MSERPHEQASHDTEVGMTKPSTQRRNLLTYLGWSIVAFAFAIGTILVVAEALLDVSPYAAIVTYLFVPVAVGFGLSLAGLGLLRSRIRRRRHQTEKRLPVIDLNSKTTRRRLFVVGVVIVLFFSVSAVGTYRAYHYTETTEFCGTICHRVMEPEYVAHKNSSHAQVACVECHVGTGAASYLRAKLAGVKQLYQVVTGSWTTPIATPLEDLPSGNRMCERCHQADTFFGAHRRVEWHFAFDEASTPSLYYMVMNIGGVNPVTGKSEGIHSHTSTARRVRYWASDDRRLQIPWIEVEGSDGTSTVFKTADAPESRPPESEFRTMDCIDCHNRVGHDFVRPATRVNAALAAGALDRGVRNAKRHAVEILNTPYPTTSAAREAITTEVSKRFGPERAEQIAALLVDIYETDQFPEQGVSWKDYVDHIGHTAFPGCFRCHDDRHVSADGRKVAMECNGCHEFVHQSHDQPAVWPQEYRAQAYQHPARESDMHDDAMCTECHASDADPFAPSTATTAAMPPQ